jgi:hypothetical protein
MLHDPSHHEPPATAEPIALAAAAMTILRRHAAEWAAIAALPVHQEKAARRARLALEGAEAFAKQP